MIFVIMIRGASRSDEYVDLNPYELNRFKTSIVFVENRWRVLNTYLDSYCEVAVYCSHS